MSLAPILVFTYNRPDHTFQTLEALRLNHLADQSDLFIFCDGAKKDTSQEGLEKMKELQKVIRQKQWCKNVKIIQRPSNFGIEKNVVYGVTEIIKTYGKAIVLEDDIVTSKGFLKYMNEALELYKSDHRIMHINGYMHPINVPNLPDTFFYNKACPWGWATWENAWDLLNMDTLSLLQKLKDIKYFNMDGSYPFYDMLKEIPGYWDVRWDASIQINKGFVLNPKKSMVSNIGFDGSGIHCVNDSEKSKSEVIQIEEVEVKQIPFVENKEVRKAIETHYSKQIPAKGIITKVKWKVIDFFSIHIFGRHFFPLDNTYVNLEQKISPRNKLPKRQAIS